MRGARCGRRPHHGSAVGALSIDRGVSAQGSEAVGPCRGHSPHGVGQGTTSRPRCSRRAKLTCVVVELLDAVVTAAAKYLSVDRATLGPDTTFAYLQIDSLDIVTILEDASAAVGMFIEIDPEKDFQMTMESTLGEFVAHLVARPD